MSFRFWVGVATSLSCAAGIASCVSDEPATTGGATDDGGGGGDGSASQDSSTAGDAASDGSGPTVCDPAATFGTATPVDELNSIGTSEEARLSSDGLFVYFSAAQTDAGGDYDLYSAQRAAPTGPFSNLTKIPSAEMKNFIEASPSITADGLVLYFSGMSTSGDGFAIYSVTRGSLAESFIATPKYLGAPVDALGDSGPFANNGDPFIREDGAELFFVSTRNSTNYHVFRAASAGDGGFTSTAVVPEVDVGKVMRYPVLSPDGLVVYFATNLAPDGGTQLDWDIFIGTRSTPSGAFTNVHRVAELSTAYDDYPDYVTRDLCTIYLHRRATGAIETIYRATKNP